MKNKFLIGFLILFSVLTLCACGDEESDIKAGKLSGTAWERKVSDKSSITEENYTATIKFTSDKGGAYTCTGSWKVYSYITKKWTTGTYNDNDKFTYVYSPELKEGVYEYSSGKKVVFSISSDLQTLSAGNKYTRK